MRSVNGQRPPVGPVGRWGFPPGPVCAASVCIANIGRGGGRRCVAGVGLGEAGVAGGGVGGGGRQ